MKFDELYMTKHGEIGIILGYDGYMAYVEKKNNIDKINMWEFGRCSFNEAHHLEIRDGFMDHRERERERVACSCK